MRKVLLLLVLGLVLTLVCALAIGVAAVRPFTVEDAGMQYELNAGDRLLTIRPLGMKTLVRGDLILFTTPHDLEKKALRRVVGLPGDHIQLRAARLILNGKAANEPYAHVTSDRTYADFPNRIDSLLFEAQPDTGEIRRLQALMLGEMVKDDQLIVPEGHYFVLSDNRDDIMDSRSYGPVPLTGVYALPAVVYETKAGFGVRRIR